MNRMFEGDYLLFQIWDLGRNLHYLCVRPLSQGATTRVYYPVETTTRWLADIYFYFSHFLGFHSFLGFHFCYIFLISTDQPYPLVLPEDF